MARPPLEPIQEAFADLEGLRFHVTHSFLNPVLIVRIENDERFVETRISDHDARRTGGLETIAEALRREWDRGAA